MKVFLLNFTPYPEKTIANAAKLCYSSKRIAAIKGAKDMKSNGGFLQKIIKKGHFSVLEHANFTFGIEGISRATSHQLVRHRIASFSQQSQRYVYLDKEADFVIPPSIKKSQVFNKKFIASIKEIHKLYKALVRGGIPAEDARYLLPNAVETKIIVTMNARELLHFFQLRCCMRSQWEMREMAKMMLVPVKKEAPLIFEKAGPFCLNGKCPEGEMTCGKEKEIREEFENM